MSQDELSKEFQAGIAAFNRRDFFAAHEIWEELWHACKDPTRDVYQGLIQVAVCLHHFDRGNTRGARKLCLSCRKYLDPYRPSHWGVDLDGLLSQLDICCAEILVQDPAALPIQLDAALIPEINYVSGSERGGLSSRDRR